MKTSKLKVSIIGAILVASVAVPLLFRQHAVYQERTQDALLRRQAEQLAELLAENKRLSNIVAQAKSFALSDDQFSELLRLRGEIGQSRQIAKELSQLQAAHQQLLAVPTNSQVPAVLVLPSPQTVLAYWPKAQLISAGYGEPTLGLQTALWAMSRNDPGALAESVTPEAASVLASSRWIGDTPAGRIAAGTKFAADSLVPSSGFYVVEAKLKPNDRVILDVYFEKEGATRGFALKKIGQEWKIDAIYLASGNEENEYGSKVWP